MKLEHTPRKREAQMVPLQIKIELLRTSLEETQKYELLTTNQYLNQMELLVEILQAFSVRVDSRTGLKKATLAGFGTRYD